MHRANTRVLLERDGTAECARRPMLNDVDGAEPRTSSTGTSSVVHRFGRVEKLS
jgi:hypothetical protein